MAIQAFTVLSEFRFDVGHAVASSETLQNSIQGISEQANNAMDATRRLGIGLIQNLSGAQAGLLGLLGNAVTAADKFMNSQLSFTQIIDSNMQHLTGNIGSLNEQMGVSRRIMNDIAKDASTFGIPATELLEMTKTLSAMLVPKGLAGENFGAARTMSRNLLKSAPNLGIHPADVQGQLLRSIEGSASMGDTLFRRLLTEAPEPFKAAGIKDAKGFNAMDAAKRFNILNDALGKFASNSGILEMRANTLTGVMQRVRDVFTSFNSILRPLGEVILPFLVKMMNMAINWLETKGRILVKTMADFIKPFLEEPQKLLIGMKQVSSLGSDFKAATGITAVIGILMHLGGVIKFLSGLPVVGPAFAWIGQLPIFSSLMKGIGAVFAGLGKTLMFLWPVFKIVLLGIFEFAAGLMAVLIPLQGLSRAIARMEIEAFAWMTENAASLTQTLKQLTDAVMIIFMPIQDMIQGFEELFFLILGGTTVLDFAKSAFESFTAFAMGAALAFNELYAGFRGLIAGMMDVIFRAMENIGTIINNLMNGNFSGMMDGTKNIFGGYMEAGAEEYQKTIDRAMTPNMDGEVDNSKVQNVQNNYDVKMTNNFKEVLQPDRIAYTIRDTLEKSSRNRTGARAGGLAARQAEAIN